MQHTTNSTNLGDLLERILDKGVVIAGDIKVKIVDIELLTIQIRFVVCSVDKAIEMGMDWWKQNPDLLPSATERNLEEALNKATAHVRDLEAKLEKQEQS